MLGPLLVMSVLNSFPSQTNLVVGDGESLSCVTAESFYRLG